MNTGQQHYGYYINRERNKGRYWSQNKRQSCLQNTINFNSTNNFNLVPIIRELNRMSSLLHLLWIILTRNN